VARTIRFQLEGPGEVSTVGDDGEEIRLTSDAAGVVEVSEDFQEAVVALTRSGLKRAKAKKES
jgi:hypothetical protein